MFINLKHLIKILILVFLIYFLIILLVLSVLFIYYDENDSSKPPLSNVKLQSSHESESECYFESEFCFNIYRCIYFNQDKAAKLRVYVYSDHYGKFSTEFREFIQTILTSDFYEANPRRACLFVPLIDLTNEFNLIGKKREVDRFISSLKYWSNGKNHLMFNMISIGSKLSILHQSALLTSSSFETSTYRNGFDLSVPMFNHLTSNIQPKRIYKKFKIISTQMNLNANIINSLQQLDIYVFDSCPSQSYFKRCLLTNHSVYAYPHLLEESTFCLIIMTDRLDKQSTLVSLYDAIKYNCIPIIAADEWILPFSEFIEWHSISLQIRLDDLAILNEIVNNNSLRVNSMLANLKNAYENYFSSISKITLAILNYYQMKIFPFSNQTKFIL